MRQAYNKLLTWKSNKQQTPKGDKPHEKQTSLGSKPISENLHEATNHISDESQKVWRVLNLSWKFFIGKISVCRIIVIL